MLALFKRVYPYFPVPVQNLGISAFGYFYKHERFGAEFGPTLQGSWNVIDGRSSAWRAMSIECFRRCCIAPSMPLTTGSDGTRGIRATDLRDITSRTLHRLPVLKKQALRQNPTALVPDRGAALKKTLSYYSSGSTGTPIRAICIRAGQQRFAAAREARSYRWAGTSIHRPGP